MHTCYKIYEYIEFQFFTYHLYSVEYNATLRNTFEYLSHQTVFEYTVLQYNLYKKQFEQYILEVLPYINIFLFCELFWSRIVTFG